jgi:maleylacetoacetate isomerase
VPVHLARGEQKRAEYAQVNPARLVPVLEAEGRRIGQSLAIIEWLEETHPEPPLLPPDAASRARVRALALTVACDIHPLNNLRVLDYLDGTLGADEAARLAWYRHWVETGLATLEALLGDDASGRYCHGDEPGLADCCLVPQVFNAQRFGCRTAHVPTVMRIHAACMDVAAFRDAAPAVQPDAE